MGFSGRIEAFFPRKLSIGEINPELLAIFVIFG
jgi:hypothetical protein